MCSCQQDRRWLVNTRPVGLRGQEVVGIILRTRWRGEDLSARALHSVPRPPSTEQWRAASAGYDRPRNTNPMSRIYAPMSRRSADTDAYGALARLRHRGVALASSGARAPAAASRRAAADRARRRPPSRPSSSTNLRAVTSTRVSSAPTIGCTRRRPSRACRRRRSNAWPATRRARRAAGRAARLPARSARALARASRARRAQQRDQRRSASRARPSRSRPASISDGSCCSAAL